MVPGDVNGQVPEEVSSWVGGQVPGLPQLLDGVVGCLEEGVLVVVLVGESVEGNALQEGFVQGGGMGREVALEVVGEDGTCEEGRWAARGCGVAMCEHVHGGKFLEGKVFGWVERFPGLCLEVVSCCFAEFFL